MAGNFLRHNAGHFGYYADGASGSYSISNTVVEGQKYWLSLGNTGVHDIAVSNVYTDAVGMGHKGGPDCTLSSIDYVDGSWPREADAIVKAAGVRSGGYT